VKFDLFSIISAFQPIFSMYNNNMKQFTEFVGLIKEAVNACGIEGLYYRDLIQLLNLSEKLGLHIARKYLSSSDFSFSLENRPVNPKTLQNIPNKLVCIASANSLCQHFGFETDEANLPNFQTDKGDPGVELLLRVAKAREKGLTALELDPDPSIRKSLSSQVDRFVAAGVFVKRMVMPIPKTPKSKASRTNSACTILHLKRYARGFIAGNDHLLLQPTENVKEEISSFFRTLLDDNSLEYLSTSDISLILHVHKRYMQYFRHQIFQLQKQFPTIIQFHERICAPLNRQQNNQYGKYRVAWCLQRGNLTGKREYDPLILEVADERFERMANLSLFDSIDYSIQKNEGISTSEIRRLTSVAVKRSGKLFSEFQKQSKSFITRRIPDNKCMMIKLFPKSPQKIILNSISTTNEEILHSNSIQEAIEKEISTEEMLLTGDQNALPLNTIIENDKTDRNSFEALDKSRIILEYLQQVNIYFFFFFGITVYFPYLIPLILETTTYWECS
jgi:hypothetical protein